MCAVISCVSSVACVVHQSAAVDLPVHPSIISTALSLPIAHSNVIERFSVRCTPIVFVER